MENGTGRKYLKDYTFGRLYIGKSVQWEVCTERILPEIHWEISTLGSHYTGKTLLENGTGRKYLKDYTFGRLYTGKSVQWEVCTEGILPERLFWKGCTGMIVHLEDFTWETVYWEDCTGKTIGKTTRRTIRRRVY